MNPAWHAENAAWLDAAQRHWLPRGRDNLLIRAWLAQPICWDGYDPITIEGALQSAVCTLETGKMPDDVFADCPRDATLEQTDIAIPIHDTPVDVGSEKPLPLALVSCGWFSPDAAQTVRWQRSRARAESYALAKVNTASDWSKSANRAKATVTAYYVEFYAAGDGELLRRLLPEVGTLGSARFSGMGLIHGWEVLGMRSCDPILGASGRLLRTVPHGSVDIAEQFDVREATLRAPYWHKRTLALCDVPIQRFDSWS